MEEIILFRGSSTLIWHVGGQQRPPWNGNSEGAGGCKPKTFRGRGMDIFWNHTFEIDYTLHLNRNLSFTGSFTETPIYTA